MVVPNRCDLKFMFDEISALKTEVVGLRAENKSMLDAFSREIVSLKAKSASAPSLADVQKPQRKKTKFPPCSTVEALLELEKRLGEDDDFKMEYMEQMISLYGAGTMKRKGQTAMLGVITKIMDNELFLSFSWTGASKSNDKQSMQAMTNLRDTLFEIVSVNDPSGVCIEDVSAFLRNRCRNSGTVAKTKGVRKCSQRNRGRVNGRKTATEPDENDGTAAEGDGDEKGESDDDDGTTKTTAAEEN